MGFIVDLIIIGIIVLSTFFAYKKGMVKLAIGLCSFIIALVLTFVLCKPISNFVINTTSIDETIENAIYEKANEIMQEGNSELANQMIETAKNEMLPETARNLAINIVKGGVALLLIIGIKIALRFVSIFADAIAKLPILNEINKIGGIIYGMLRGILLVYVVLLLLSISGQINPKNIANDSINKSSLGKTMYQNNVLNVFFP